VGLGVDDPLQLEAVGRHHLLDAQPRERHQRLLDVVAFGRLYLLLRYGEAIDRQAHRGAE
jgi:hypothetical protein